MKTNVLKNNYYILKLAWEMCPKRVAAAFFSSALNNFSWVFSSIVFIKYVITSLETGKSYGSIVLFVIASMVMFAGIDFYNNWYNTEFRPITDNIIYEKLNKILFDKASEVELACYEDTEFYNSYTLAIKEADVRISSVLDNISAIIFAVIASISVMISMYQTDKFVILFVAFPFIGNFVFGSMGNKVYYTRDAESVPYQRKMDYVSRTIYLQNYAKEIRLSNIFNLLKRTYEEGFMGICGVIEKHAVKGVTLVSIREIFNFLFIYVGVLLYGAYGAVVTKTITISDFAVLSGAMVSASWILIGLCENIITTFQNSLYIKNLLKFIKYKSVISENQDGITPSTEINSIELRGVNFTYKGQSQPVLRNVNITIKRKEKIAIVGHNGAGKTTLVKLLMRLYDPETGEILVNGTNIKNYNVKKYRSLFGTAFQDYQMFSMTIGENVLMRKLKDDSDYKRVKEALQKSGVYEKVMTLKKTINNVLTREFDDEGAVLSGGELQKIALARVFAKVYGIAIFDEPSSALDPIAEYKLFENMMEACKDKTVIFISHRLSSVVHADRIYMFEDGRIIEEGTHLELMNKGGKYADMFNKQAEKYNEESA